MIEHWSSLNKILTTSVAVCAKHIICHSARFVFQWKSMLMVDLAALTMGEGEKLLQDRGNEK
jgi:hypothetical protein